MVYRALCLLVVFSALCGSVRGFPLSSSPQKVLTEADRFAWSGNWKKARTLYEMAEEEARDKGDARNALGARIGAIHSRIGSTSLTDLIGLLEQEFKNPTIGQNPDLKLRWFLAKAQLIEQLDLSESRRCWSEVLALAKQIRNKGWERRASGQLGALRWQISHRRSVAQHLESSFVTTYSLRRTWLGSLAGP
jgi:hypothetical protein